MVLAVTLVAVALAGCGPDVDEQLPPIKVYTIRGEIVSLPPAEQSREWIGVRHEAIPDFVGLLGDPEPMKAMTMPFTVGEGVDPSSLEVGDKIVFELEVDWSAGNPARVISIEALAPETELELAGAPADPSGH